MACNPGVSSEANGNFFQKTKGEGQFTNQTWEAALGLFQAFPSIITNWTAWTIRPRKTYLLWALLFKTSQLDSGLFFCFWWNFSGGKKSKHASRAFWGATKTLSWVFCLLHPASLVRRIVCHGLNMPNDLTRFWNVHTILNYPQNSTTSISTQISSAHFQHLPPSWHQPPQLTAAAWRGLALKDQVAITAFGPNSSKQASRSSDRRRRGRRVFPPGTSGAWTQFLGHWGGVLSMYEKPCRFAKKSEIPAK